MAAGVMLLAAAGTLVAYLDPNRQHRRTVGRIVRWVRPDMPVPPGGEPREVREVRAAIYAAAVNWPLWYRENAPTDKLAAVADYLDRTKGADLSSYVGALHVLSLLEAVSPSLHEYPFVVQLREMQADGTLPPPPRTPTARDAK